MPGFTTSEARDLLRHDLQKAEKWATDPLMQATVPPAGSPLSVDDEAWSYQPLSASLATCHTTALDHVRAVAALVNAGSWHPMATFSLTRSALVAGAHGVYLTECAEPRERQVRNLAYARETLRQRSRYNKEMSQYPGVLARPLAFSHGHLALRARGIEVASQRLGLQVSPALPKTTPLMKLTAPIVLPDPEMRGHVMAQWMTSSSDAHALHWGALLRSAEQGAYVEQIPPGGVHRVGIGGDERATALYVHVAALFLSWSLRRTRELSVVGRPPDEVTQVRTDTRDTMDHPRPA